jgi:hypothetical protein
MTHMAQMILSKPLVIIGCMFKEMMRWLRRLLNGVAYEYEPNKLHTTELIVADITFVFLFHNTAEHPQQRDGQKSPPSEYRDNGETD